VTMTSHNFSAAQLTCRRVGSSVLRDIARSGAECALRVEQVHLFVSCFANSSEDHVWTEYWSPASQHWVHVDSW
jgi:hypothetical protein